VGGRVISLWASFLFAVDPSSAPWVFFRGLKSSLLALLMTPGIGFHALFPMLLLCRTVFVMFDETNPRLIPMTN